MKPTECDGQMSLFSPGVSHSHVSRFPSPGTREASEMTVSSGLKCLESSQSSGPLGLLERMLLGSSEWHSTECLLTWKVKTTPAGRSYFQLQPSEPNTDGTGSQFVPTPTASDHKRMHITEKAQEYKYKAMQSYLSGGGGEDT